jgi:hypothetical protein
MAQARDNILQVTQCFLTVSVKLYGITFPRAVLMDVRRSQTAPFIGLLCSPSGRIQQYVFFQMHELQPGAPAREKRHIVQRDPQA